MGIKLKEWTDTETTVFRKTYGATDDQALAERFRCSREEIRLHARKNALGKNTDGRRTRARWTPEQAATLRELYPSRPNLEIARALGHSVKSVVSKGRKLGLKKDRERLRAMGRENVSRRRAER